MANKSMSLKSLKGLESKKFTTKQIVVGNYSVEIDEVFRNTKIVALLQEFMKQINYAKEKDIEIDALTYTTVLILKYFSNVDVSDKYEDQIHLLAILTDLEDNGETYLNLILSAFDENEINKLNKKMTEYGKNLTKLVEEMKAEQELEELSEVVETAEEVEEIIE